MYTGGLNSEKRMDVFQAWSIETKIKAVKTENASEMVIAIEILQRKLKDDMPELQRKREEFYVCCLDYVINLTVREAMETVHSKISNV